MLNLPKRKSTFNFYESFSDLVFCALVMFLVLVLFLAMSVNQKQEQVEVDLAEVKQTRELAEQEAELAKQAAEELRAQAQKEAELAKEELKKQQELRIALLSQRDTELAKIEKQRQEIIADAQKLIAMERTRIEAERAKVEAELKAQRERMAAVQAKAQAELKAQREQMAKAQAKAEAEFDVQRSALAKMERDLDQQRRVYEQALGTNRFTGLPGTPRIVVAYDWQPNRIAIHTVPGYLVEALNTTPPGLDGRALSDYYAQQRAIFLEVAKEAKPLTPRQYRALIRAVSVGLEPLPRVGEESRVSLDLVFVANDEGGLTNEVGLVIPGGNGQQSGVKVGDTLIALGEQAVSPDQLPALLKRFKPGDKARLLVRRAGKPQAINVIFSETRVVELIDAYRTDLSMVVSGALDSDYTYLWAPARADALRAQLQEGKANDAVWQGQSRWQDRGSNAGRPVLKFDVQPGGKAVVIGGEPFEINQFRRVLESIGGGGIVVEYTPKQGPKELPKTIYDQALRPTGFVIRAPQLDELLDHGGDE